MSELAKLIAVPDERGVLHLGIACRYGWEGDESIGGDCSERYGVAFLSDSPDEFAPVDVAIDALPLLLNGRWFVPPLAASLSSDTYRLEPEQSSAVRAHLSEYVLGRGFATAMGGSRCPRTGEWRLRGTTWSIKAAEGSVMPSYYLDLYPDYDYCHWDRPL